MDGLPLDNILSAIGHTPIVRLNRITSGVSSTIHVKLEALNPGGSIKDRAAVYMCRKARDQGRLAPGAPLVESTSGNTGIGVCLYACTHGHPCVLVMTDKQSPEKIAYLKAFGAKVVLCPSQVSHADACSHHVVAARLARLLNGYHLDQYSNPHNSECHYRETGPEIWQQTGGQLDVFFAGVGTGGTVSGTGRLLKERNPDIEIRGVDCEGSVLAPYFLTGEMGSGAPYHLEGIGDTFIPANLDLGVLDGFDVVSDAEAFLMARRLTREEGIFTGGSGGAVVAAALRHACRQRQPKRILVLLPDGGNRYTSRIYNDAWMAAQGFQEAVTHDRLSEHLTQLLEDRGRLV